MEYFLQFFRNNGIIVLELTTTLAAIGTFVNIFIYLASIVRNLENKYQAEASAQNSRINKLEGQVDALINSNYNG